MSGLPSLNVEIKTDERGLLSVGDWHTHDLQAYYGCLPNSIARFSTSEEDVVVYTGYGMDKSIQFYDLRSKSVTRSIPLTHWARAMALSPQGHLIATGINGM